MSTDPFAHDDAAYVLGALSPTRRQAFEEHLAECADCTRAVRDLAGIPGLLARLDGSTFTGTEVAPPVPDTLLPQLLRRVRRQRRRSRWVAVASAAAAAVSAAVLAVSFVGGDDNPPPQAQAMTQVDQQSLQATVALQQVAWGTRMYLSCSYVSLYGEGDPPSSYALVVHTRDGGSQQVATWRALPGRTAELGAATNADLDQIKTLDVVDVDTGRSVLTLRPRSA